MLPVEGEKALQALLGKGPFGKRARRQHGGAVADEFRAPGDLQRREIQLGAQQIDRDGQISDRVDQGSVEIEEKGIEGH